jgi:Putative Flp pilus-assembly TadE/G-like
VRQQPVSSSSVVRRVSLLSLRLTARSDKGDDGVILILWVLSLAALFGFMALVLNIGDLLQSSDNVQNAADSAALYGADSLHANSVYQPVVSIPSQYRCTLALSRCTTRGSGPNSPSSYAWLQAQDLYIYEGLPTPTQGWEQIVVASSGASLPPGEISDVAAFELGAASGPWLCSLRGIAGRFCTQIDTDVAGTGNDALGDGSPVAATNAAEALVHDSYSITANWNGCPGLPPPGFYLAEGWAGTTCIAYCAPASNAPCGGRAVNFFWVMALVQAPPSIISGDGVTCTGRVAWAIPTALAPGAPLPSGKCSGQAG